MKVLFFFPPTGTDGEEYASKVERELTFEEDTLRVYLQGCQHPNIGNGLISPELDIAANHIYNAFGEKSINIDQLKANLGDGIHQIFPQNLPESLVEVESIALNGHSRGAMSTFAVARKLNALNIPLDIVANQPVPGETLETSYLTRNYSDLRQCSNIRSASVLLATHSNHNSWWHNVFFKQLLPVFSSNTVIKHFLLPIHEHFARESCAISEYHTGVLLSNYGYTQNREKYITNIKNYYDAGEKYCVWRSCFIPSSERQSVLGDKNELAPDPVYLELQSERATSFLNKKQIMPSETLEPAQAAAINYLIKTYPDIPEKYMTLLLEKSPKGERFCHIINTITETCHYVATLQRNGNSKKESAIRQAALTYQQQVFAFAYDFLSLNNPSQTEQVNFKNAITGAEHQFRNDALGIERNGGRYFMKFLTNFILHITGIGIIANIVHKAQTGNWLFFNHNRSTTIIKEMRETLFNDNDNIISSQSDFTTV